METGLKWQVLEDFFITSLAIYSVHSEKESKDKTIIYINKWEGPREEIR